MLEVQVAQHVHPLFPWVLESEVQSLHFHSKYFITEPLSPGLSFNEHCYSSLIDQSHNGLHSIPGHTCSHTRIMHTHNHISCLSSSVLFPVSTLSCLVCTITFSNEPLPSVSHLFTYLTNSCPFHLNFLADLCCSIQKLPVPLLP